MTSQQELDLSRATTVECERCSNKTFKQTMIIKKLSAIISPNGQTTLVPIGVFACEKCGHVNEDMVDAITTQ
jgi:uncharacterized Zn finger protein